MKVLSCTVFNGIMLDVWELSDRHLKDQAGYLQEMRHLDRSEPLHNEMRRINNAAGKAIMRTTKSLQQIAYNRGVLHGMGTLDKRIKELSLKKAPTIKETK